MLVREEIMQEKIERNESLIEAIDKRLPVAKKESEIAKTKTISKPDDIGIALDFMIKTRVVENLLDIKIATLENIGRVLKEAKKEEE